ncbi:helix-turn-helix domain-containing protein [Proteus cibi]|uniref:helix-turn-helix domain-containing protein n=1 Tax=Proteus cibi TaxID=2050966 RepID=UPI0035A5D890
MSEINTLVGQRIKQKRKQLKLTGIEMGRRLGISQQHYSRLENGHIKITVDQLITISLILGVSPQSLLLTSEIMSPMLNALAERTLYSSDVIVLRNKKRRHLK